MSRPLRLQFPGAVYHITARGNAGEAIFFADSDRQLFLRTLAEVVERFRWQCHAYCLMGNHYHLLIETGEANLARGMRHLNGVYTQRFNRRHGRVGHLLQGRYKSILVERAGYLLELARYIVLNPVRAQLVEDARLYPWSSYRATAGMSLAPEWLATDWILSQFAESRVPAIARYRRFVAAGHRAASPWRGLCGQVILGSESFMQAASPLLEQQRAVGEIPRFQRLAHRPTLDALLPPHVRSDKQARDRALRQACLEYGYTLAAAARHVQLHYSTVSKVIHGLR